MYTSSAIGSNNMESWKQNLKSKYKEIEDTRPLKIGLYGMKHNSNQFANNLESYPVEVVRMTDNDSLPHRDSKFDAVILTPYQISHGRFKKVKDSCKDSNIKLFIASGGFTSIKESFESYLITMNRLNAEPKEPIQSQPIEVENSKGSKKLFNYTKEQVNQRDSLVYRLYKAEMNYSDISEYLESEGFVRPKDGNPLNNNDVAAVVHRIKKNIRKGKLTEAQLLTDSSIKPSEPSSQKKPVIKTSTSNTATPVKAAFTKSDNSKKLKKSDLEKAIDSILSKDNLTPELKLELIEKARRGEFESKFVTEEGTYKGSPVIQLYEMNCVTGEKTLVIGMGVRKATAVVQCSAQIVQFINSHR